MSDRSTGDSGKTDLEEILELIKSGADPEAALLDRALEVAAERSRTDGPDLADALRYAAIPRRVSAEIIGVLRETPDDVDGNEEVVAFLAEQPIVRRRQDGDLAVQHEPRRLLLERWRAGAERERFESFNRRLIDHYEAQYESALRARADLDLATEVIRPVNRARYLTLKGLIDRAETRPLLETLYHKVLSSLSEGWSYFTQRFARYEEFGLTSMNRSLVRGMKDVIQHAEGEDVARRGLWLQYYEARHAAATGRHREAEKVLVGVVSAAEDDHVLYQWALLALGNAFNDQDRLQEAADTYLRALEASERSGYDRFNQPTTLVNLGVVHENMGRLEEAVSYFRQAIASAHEVENFLKEIQAGSSLVSSLYRSGKPDEAFQTALLMVDRVRTRPSLDPNLDHRVIESLMGVIEGRPQLLDTLYAEVSRALPGYAARARFSLGTGYLARLRRGGRLTRAAAVSARLHAELAEIDNPASRSDLLYQHGSLVEAQGDLEGAVEAHTEILGGIPEGQVSWTRAQALSNRGLVLRLLGRWQEGLEDYTSARDVWEAIGNRTLRAALCTFMADLHERHHRAVEAELAAGSPDTGAGGFVRRFAGGDLHFMHGRWSEADEAYVAASGTIGEDRPGAAGLVSLRRAVLEASRGGWSAAVEHLAAAITDWEQQGDAPLGVTIGSGDSKLLMQAQELLDEAEPDLGDDQLRWAGFHIFGGTVLRDRGLFVDAARELGAARTLLGALNDPESSAAAIVQLAEVSAAGGSWPTAVQQLRDLKTLWGRHADAEAYVPTPEAELAEAEGASGLAAFYEGALGDLGRSSSARDHYDEAEQHDPTLFWYPMSRAYISMALGEWAEAATALARALDAAGDAVPSELFHPRLAHCHVQAGQSSITTETPREAYAHFDAARSLLTGLSDEAAELVEAATWRDVGDGFLRAGYREEAEAWYRTCLDDALVHDPADVAALHFRRAFVAARVGDVTEASVHLGRGIEEVGSESAQLHEILDDVIGFVGDARDFVVLSEGLRVLAGDTSRPWAARVACRRALLSLAGSKYRTVLRPLDHVGEESALLGTPIALLAATSVFPEGEDWTTEHPLFQEYLPQMRERVLADTGVELPGVRVRAIDDMDPHEFRMLLSEAVVSSGRVEAGGTLSPLISHLPWGLDRLAGGLTDYIAGKGDPGRARLSYMVLHLERVLRGYLHTFVGLDELSRMIDVWLAGVPSWDRAAADGLLAEAVPDALARVKLLRVLHALLRESVPVIQMSVILSTLTDDPEADAGSVAEVVRWKLSASIPATNPDRTFVRVGTETEEELKGYMRSRMGAPAFSLPSESRERLFRRVARAVGTTDPHTVSLVTADPELRPFLKAALAHDYPSLSVVALRELGPEVELAGAAELNGEVVDG